MKGLTVNSMKKKDEAKTLVKKGLAANIKSHVCWHAYGTLLPVQSGGKLFTPCVCFPLGLIYRAERMYDDAIKCYQNALRIDSDNLQILKDLSLLQIQQRNIEGFQETRRRILVLKPNNANWVAFAVGNHLSERYDRCLEIISSYENTIKTQPVDDDEKSARAYENSELKLYKNQVMIEGKQHEKALNHLDEIEKDVKDKNVFHETKGRTFFCVFFFFVCGKLNVLLLVLPVKPPPSFPRRFINQTRASVASG